MELAWVQWLEFDHAPFPFDSSHFFHRLATLANSNRVAKSTVTFVKRWKPLPKLGELWGLFEFEPTQPNSIHVGGQTIFNLARWLELGVPFGHSGLTWLLDNKPDRKYTARFFVSEVDHSLFIAIQTNPPSPHPPSVTKVIMIYICVCRCQAAQ